MLHNYKDRTDTVKDFDLRVFFYLVFFYFISRVFIFYFISIIFFYRFVFIPHGRFQKNSVRTYTIRRFSDKRRCQ